MQIPGFPGGFDLNEMLQQAKEMQDKFQREMNDVRVEASAGGGMVSVTMSGNKEILAIRIDPEAVKDGDVEMLQDMIVAAANEASRKATEKLQSKLGGMLPPGMGF